MKLPVELNDENILVAGIGGGFDIFGCIPIMESLPPTENDWHPVLTSYNPNCKQLGMSKDYYPESGFAYYWTDMFDWPLYVIPKGGVKALVPIYEKIMKENNIETVVCVDGGVDALMLGNEEGAGTFLEDTISIVAINLAANNLGIERQYLSCIGFGTELEEDLCHYHALENIATLSKSDDFLGCCALTKNDYSFDIYRSVCEKTWHKNRKSHVQTKIISSVLGEFGNSNLYDGVDAQIIGVKESKNFITPLMSIYWFFNLQGVVRENKLAKHLLQSTTFTDALMLFRQVLGTPEYGYKKRESLPY